MVGGVCGWSLVVCAVMRVFNHTDTTPNSYRFDVVCHVGVVSCPVLALCKL